MRFYNDKLAEALFSHNYLCHECGEQMEFEDENEDILVCPKCGHSVELEQYGFEGTDEYDKLYPTKEELENT